MIEKIKSWFGIKPEYVPEPLLFVGEVRRSPLHSPYMTIYTQGQMMSLYLNRVKISVKLDRKIIPYLIPLLEKISIKEET